MEDAVQDSVYPVLEDYVSTSPAIVRYNNQSAKADAGKPRLTLVPRQIIWDIAEIREYGVKKYHEIDNWKKVEIERYRDAAYRHFMKYLDDPDGVDEESGLSNLKHLACNIAFLCDMERRRKDGSVDGSEQGHL